MHNAGSQMTLQRDIILSAEPIVFDTLSSSMLHALGIIDTDDYQVIGSSLILSTRTRLAVTFCMLTFSDGATAETSTQREGHIIKR